MPRYYLVRSPSGWFDGERTENLAGTAVAGQPLAVATLANALCLINMMAQSLQIACIMQSNNTFCVIMH